MLQATRISWSAAIAGRCLRIWASCSSTSGITANCGSHVNVTPSMEQPQVRTRKKDLLSFPRIHIYIHTYKNRLKMIAFRTCEFRYVLHFFKKFFNKKNLELSSKFEGGAVVWKHIPTSLFSSFPSLPSYSFSKLSLSRRCWIGRNVKMKFESWIPLESISFFHWSNGIVSLSFIRSRVRFKG